MPEIILSFVSLQQARDYRHQNGTGGWIFENEATKVAVLFPPYMAPISIFHHPMTRGCTGRLV